MPTCSGVCDIAVAIEDSPTPMKNTATMPSRLHLSASQPAGSENKPNAKKPGVAYFRRSP
jgi:hypothetical protein